MFMNENKNMSEPLTGFNTGANGLTCLSIDGGNLWVSLSSGICFKSKFI